jgi:hypothetical protein
VEAEDHQGDSAGAASGRKALSLVGGILLGWVGSWVSFIVVLLTGVADVSSRTRQTVAFAVGLGAVPVAAVVLLLLGRSRRLFGVGLLLGLAIGSIVGSGVCASWIVSGT